MGGLTVLLIALVVLAGAVYSGVEVPLGFAPERESPQDRVKESQIKVFEDKIIIEVSGASWAKFANTNSMDPFLDEGANSIEIKPESPEDIKVGDVISYDAGFGLVVHRVIAVEEDEEGLYYVVKGDNNTFADSQKVRFDDVNGVLIAVIY